MKNTDLSAVEKIIGYSFVNKELLKVAFTHSSYSNEHRVPNNERLEFLGDSVLGIVVAKYLFDKKTKMTAGEMTAEKQKLVSTVPLSDLIRKLGLGEYLICGESMQLCNNKPRSVLENLCESVIGAIYLDGGMSEAETFVKRFLLKNPECSEKKVKDYKSELQIYSQSIKAGTPKYQLVSRTGPDHDPLFTISVEVAGVRTAGSGKSKAEASQKAAQRALKKITGRNN